MNCHGNAFRRDKQANPGPEARAWGVFKIGPGKSATLAVMSLLATTLLLGCSPDEQLSVPIESSRPSSTPSFDPPLDNNQFIAPSLEQAMTIEQMDGMTLEDYARLPFADRLAYAIAKRDGSYPIARPGNEDWILEQPEAIPAYFWQGGYGAAFNNASADERAKLAGSYGYYTTDQSGQISESFIEASGVAVQYGGEGVGSNAIFHHVANGLLQHGQDRDGRPIDFLNITYTIEDANTGTSQGEKTGQAIRTEVMLLNGETVVFYALGFVIEGRLSPVENYPY